MKSSSNKWKFNSKEQELELNLIYDYTKKCGMKSITDVLEVLPMKDLGGLTIQKLIDEYNTKDVNGNFDIEAIIHALILDYASKVGMKNFVEEFKKVTNCQKVNLGDITLVKIIKHEVRNVRYELFRYTRNL